MSDIERIRALRNSGEHEAARTLAVELTALQPSDAPLQYEAACLHDYLGRGGEAIGFYRAALAGTLANEPRRGAYLGLCSSYRARGLYHEALAVADAGLSEFPDAYALQVFRAIALYNLNDGKQAVSALLQVLAQTTADAETREYAPAILLYAQDPDRQWLD